MAGTVRCSTCFNAIPIGSPVCPACGADRSQRGGGGGSTPVHRPS